MFCVRDFGERATRIQQVNRTKLVECPDFVFLITECTDEHLNKLPHV